MNRKERRSRAARRRTKQKEEWLPLGPSGKNHFVNRDYSVEMIVLGSKEGMGEHIQLKIVHRRRKEVKYDDLMRIKDQLIGVEAEAVQLYPARSREADVSEVVLWGFAKTAGMPEEFQWPIGYPAKD